MLLRLWTRPEWAWARKVAVESPADCGRDGRSGALEISGCHVVVERADPRTFPWADAHVPAGDRYQRVSQIAGRLRTSSRLA